MTTRSLVRIIILAILALISTHAALGATGDDKSGRDSLPLPVQPLTCSLPVLASTPPATPPPPASGTTSIVTGSSAPFASVQSFPEIQNSFKWKGSGFDVRSDGSEIPLQANTAYLFHVTTWTRNSDPKKAANLTTSTWYLYSQDHLNKEYVKRRATPPIWGDQPLVYGLNPVVLFVVEGPDNSSCKANGCYPTSDNFSVNTSYAISLSQQIPSYINDGITLLTTAIGAAGTGGIHTAIAVDNSPPPKPEIRVCIKDIPIDATGKHLPYDVTINFTQSVPSKDDPSKTTDGPALNRTVHALDRSPVGFGMGMNLYRVRETQITDDKGTVNSSDANRVNVYAFADLYWPVSLYRPSNWFYPHVLAGVPINGQPLHRPFVGLSQPIPGLEKWLGFSISGFGGVVFLREKQPPDLSVVGQSLDPAKFESSLQVHWIRKSMFGIELPVGQLIGKFKSK